jgi:prevent-host-death family protein
MADSVNIHEAKTHLSRLLERVRRGAVITIAKAGVPVAHLVPVGRPLRARQVREATTLPVSPMAADRAARVRRFLEQEAWPATAGAGAGRPLTRKEEDAILGYGEAGV